MSHWFWKSVAIVFVVKTFLVCYLRADDTVKKLPFCNPTNPKDGSVHNDLMIVSTLDGKLTAFSTQNGIKVWDIETKPLLSSNLHQIQLNAGGKLVRLVPSLRGTLYSLSGDVIEPLPFDAEQLLSASYKYSEDLVIAGAKESIWYGLDATTGGVLYECNSSGCNNEQATNAKDVLVLRRHSNTVRALDPRVGNEKWNFSVAEHQLVVSRGSCGGGAPGPAPPRRVSVALHDGRLALRAPGETTNIWQQQLDAPLAGMWRFSSGALQTIDVLWEASQSLSPGELTQQPTLYIGVHERQLYVHESPHYIPKLDTALSSVPMPWKLVSARPQIGSETALQIQEDNALSKVILYGPSAMVGDYGFFLYLQETCDQSIQVTEEDVDSETNGDDHHHIHVHVYSLWFWWKEVLLIAVSSALLMNLVIWPRLFAPKISLPPPLPLNQEYIVVERHYERPTPPTPEYICRYETDFTPLRCLGRGGFGVVFEARNNIDHCSYAVKRITLPRKEKKRERVLREVRALAKLEHEHIVRYFNAWLETPPPLWQRQRDALWTRDLEDVSLIMSDEYTPAEKGSVMLNLQRPDDCIDALDYQKGLQPKRVRSQSCSDSFSIVFDENAKVTSSKDQSTRVCDVTPSKHVTDDDSYVVFEHSNAHHSHNTSGHNSSVHNTSGHNTSGHNTSGHNTSGHNTSGHNTSGHNTSGHNTSGHNTSGHNTSGHNTSGHNTLGHITSSPGHSPGYMRSGYSQTRQNSFDKRLERVKECDFKTDSTISKKKKGHTRHWSLDMMVKSSSAPDSASVQMYLYIQMQLCRRDSLHDWLRNNRTIEERGAMAKTLFSQIVSAVEYVHLAGLIHRDLKPSNILFALDGRVKVGDFGLVTAMGDTSGDGPAPGEIRDGHRHTYKVGTHLYMSPEQLQGLPYSYKVDIYSLGLILFELLQPFGTEAERVSCLMKIRNQLYPAHFHQDYPCETKVLKLMLSEDPSHRPTASGVRARAPLYEVTEEKYHFTLPAMAAA